MSRGNLKLVIVASTAGSVMNEVLKSDFFRSMVHSVVVDRECEAIEKARWHGIRTKRILEKTPHEFCDLLLDYLITNSIDYIFSYYTDFYSAKLRESYQDRIINFHPSLLPAFRGMDGFGDSAAYHARFVGNTAEFIDQVMDEGKIILQTACPLDTNVPLHVVRHRIFVQQCQSVLQIAKWLSESRITVEGRQVNILDAQFNNPYFSPALDFDDAIQLAQNLQSTG